MPMQDVSEDPSMIHWLRQAGHGHLIEDQFRKAVNASSPPPSNPPHGQNTSPANYPPQLTSLSSPPPSQFPPSFSAGFNTASPSLDALNRSGSFGAADFNRHSTYGAGGSPAPPMIPSLGNFNGSPFDQQHSPLNFSASPTQFLAPNLNDQQLDINIENMRRDPNTRVVQRPPVEDLVYKQRVFVRYLQPPTPPVGGTIIVREKQEPGPPPDPPIVIKRAPPPPPTPPPVVIRERPPPIPPAEGTTVIDKLVPPGPKPPPQVIIEQYPQLPQKPQDVIIERWLPVPPRQRRILYERLPPNTRPGGGRPIIVQYGPPHVRIQREVITQPGSSLPYPQVTGHTDVNQVLSQLGGHQSLQSSSLPQSSLLGYNPYTSMQPGYSPARQSPANIFLMQNGQPSTLGGSSYGMPLTCVCTPNQNAGLGAYGSGTSSVPMMGQTAGQSTVYNIPDNVPMEGVLRQLGVDPSTIQRSSSHIPSDLHGWNSAPHPNPSDHQSAISHVWNAASHAPDQQRPNSSAISHVWNAASHAPDQQRPGSSSTGHVWDRIENYLHPQSHDAVQSVWNHIPHQNSGPPPSNYPPPSSGNYPPPSGPQGNYPPPSGPQGNYPPPSSSYPPPGGSSGGGGGAGAGVLARLFGGGQ